MKKLQHLVKGAVVGPDGMFEMEVGKQDTVLIQIRFCFSIYYAIYLPGEDFKRIVLSRRLEKKSKKILADLSSISKDFIKLVNGLLDGDAPWTRPPQYTVTIVAHPIK
jgi:hypothetical protein